MHLHDLLTSALRLLAAHPGQSYALRTKTGVAHIFIGESTISVQQAPLVPVPDGAETTAGPVAEAVPAKRGPGRPRKNPAPAEAAAPVTPTPLASTAVRNTEQVHDAAELHERAAAPAIEPPAPPAEDPPCTRDQLRALARETMARLGGESARQRVVATLGAPIDQIAEAALPVVAAALRALA